MSLPKLSTPKYQLTLPSTRQTVSYRPFTVREEKNLLIAMQSNNKNDHIGTVVDVISTCIDEEISVEDLTMNDIEYLMVKLRTTSVGETGLLCQRRIERRRSDPSCGQHRTDHATSSS